MSVATALVKATSPKPELAADAVRIALDKAGLDHPNAVLLYLSADFARDPDPAIRAAARAAGCLQIAGCTATGLFTEEDWVLDSPAAAALVLGGDYRLQSPQAGEPVFTLSAPNALDWNWLAACGERYGGVSGDATGRGPYKVWQAARCQAGGHCELCITGGRVRIGVSHGVRPLNAPATLTAVSGHDILAVEGEPALSNLVHELPPATRERLPLHLLMLGVTYGMPMNALEEGRYHLLPVLASNAQDHSITVAAQIPLGSRIFWAMRLPQAAEYEMRNLVEGLCADTLDDPCFALMFSCTGRGPYFYDGEDRDILQFTRHFPDTPLIGFYGNGEIAHLDGANRLMQYSAVLALFHDHVPA
jgi:small ligand-binding sensory domain FIST